MTHRDDGVTDQEGIVVPAARKSELEVEGSSTMTKSELVEALRDR